MLVDDYLSYRAKLYGMPRSARRQAVATVVERCWLKDVRTRRIGKLSKGYKQRVGLAAALIHQPRVLLLDEPTNGLDPTQIHETRALIRGLAQDRTVLVSSHILGEVERLCDRVLIVSGGELKADGMPRELVSRSRHASVYVVQVKRSRPDDDERVLKLWSNIPYIADVQPNVAERSSLVTGWSLWLLTAKAGAPDLREQIAKALHEHGFLVRELRRDMPSLERVFLSLIEGDEPRAPLAPDAEAEPGPTGSTGQGARAPGP